MTAKRLKWLILSIITLIVIAVLGGSLIGSLTEPQISDRLQLYQTDLLLHATEIEEVSKDGDELGAAQTAILGKDPIGTALEQYRTVRQSAETNLKKFESKRQSASNPAESTSTKPLPAPNPPTTTADSKQVQSAIRQQQTLINQLDLRIGLLQAQQGNSAAAIATWTGLIDRATDNATAKPLVSTASVLVGLWSDPARLLPDAEQRLQKNLEGWFRYKALSRLYQLQQRPDALNELRAAEQKTAQQTLVKLALVGTAPLLGGIIGLILLILLVARWLSQRKQAAPSEVNYAWEVPWDGEVIWQVLIVGFFFIGQIVLPLLLSGLGISSSLSALGSRARAVYTLTYYLLMAGSGLLVLYLSIRRFRPLPDDWFRLTGKRNWFLWGVGGYFAALPLMLGISLLNQQIWQGQGGSNPLLQIVLEEGDGLALAIFFFTAAVAAPVFEELLFRGFLLPSLTRYVPVWGAIVLSSLIFAIAHLSLSEVLPLAVLGSVLGFVYTRSRGLLSSMLLHSLWNSITMIGLFVLGSGVK
jgi:membrane protease YdiL (CAAX protease family)